MGQRPLELLELLNREAVGSARRAVGARAVVVAGAIGSAEPTYAPASTMSAKEIVQRMSPHAETLVAQAIDLLLFETVNTPSEVEAIAEIARQLSIPFGIGLTCRVDGRTHAGVSMPEVVRAFERALPRIFFVQCTRVDLVEKPFLELARTGAAIGVYANDGRIWRDRRWHGDRISPADYAKHARRWAELGAKVIGGCCGTAPEHIAALRDLYGTR